MNDNFSADQIPDRREMRHQRRTARYSYHWVAGIILIVIGAILFMQNMKMITFNNWWAFFILIPALGSFETARQMVGQAGGKFTDQARSAVILGVILLLVTATFLLNLNWLIMRPVLLLMGGVGLLVNSLLRQ